MISRSFAAAVVLAAWMIIVHAGTWQSALAASYSDVYAQNMPAGTPEQNTQAISTLWQVVTDMDKRVYDQDGRLKVVENDDTHNLSEITWLERSLLVLVVTQLLLEWRRQRRYGQKQADLRSGWDGDE